MFFDGSSMHAGAGAGIVLISPEGEETRFEFRLKPITNNAAEYESLIIGLSLAVDCKIQALDVKGDSQLVINQVLGEFECKEAAMIQYKDKVAALMKEIPEITIEHIPRGENHVANDLAQHAALCETLPINEILCQSPTSSSATSPSANQEWYDNIWNHLKSPHADADRGLKIRALKFTLINDILYKRAADGMLLRCLSKDEATSVMFEVHQGNCGAHRAGLNMRWAIHRQGYYWPSMTKDCISYAKGCKSCQQFGDINNVPASELKAIIRPWPFKAWAMDIIGKIHPPSTKGHAFIVVITDYFTKWTEAVPLRTCTQKEIIKFVKEHVIHRFGIPQSITTDQGTMFTGDDFRAFIGEYGIKLIHSSPYYPQANGQAEAANKVLINIIKRSIEDQPRRWHEKLSEALWACRNARTTATGFSPFYLTFGHEAVLPAEVMWQSLRTAQQHQLSIGDYEVKMMEALEELDEDRINALDRIKQQKFRVAKYYNKHVREKSFSEGEFVWKAILPLKRRIAELGKWSPNWEGPYIVKKRLSKDVYILMDMDGVELFNGTNAQYLKKYYPAVM